MSFKELFSSIRKISVPTIFVLVLFPVSIWLAFSISEQQKQISNTVSNIEEDNPVFIAFQLFNESSKLSDCVDEWIHKKNDDEIRVRFQILEGRVPMVRKMMGSNGKQDTSLDVALRRLEVMIERMSPIIDSERPLSESDIKYMQSELLKTPMWLDQLVHYAKHLNSEAHLAQSKIILTQSNHILTSGFTLVALMIGCIVSLYLISIRAEKDVKRYELSSGKARAKRVEIEILSRNQTLLLAKFLNVISLKVSERFASRDDVTEVQRLLSDISYLMEKDLKENLKDGPVDRVFIKSLIKGWVKSLDQTRLKVNFDIGSTPSLSTNPERFRQALTCIGRLAQTRPKVTIGLDAPKTQMTCYIGTNKENERCLYFAFEVPAEAAQTGCDRTHKSAGSKAYEEPLLGVLVEVTIYLIKLCGGSVKISSNSVVPTWVAAFPLDKESQIDSPDSDFFDSLVQESMLLESSALVLVSEPNTGARNKLEVLLHKEGFGITFVENEECVLGIQGVNAQFNGAIIDFTSFGGGIALANIFSASHPHTPVWIAVSTQEEIDVVEATNFMVLRKPLKTSDIRQVAGHVRSNHEARMESLLVAGPMGQT